MICIAYCGGKWYFLVMETSIDSIIDIAHSYLPTLNESRVRAACALGEGPAMVHSLESTLILLSLKPDEDTIVASLLHDLSSISSVSLDLIEKEFGLEVVRLIQGTEKLNLVKMQSGRSQVESWRRMFLAIAKDLRVIFIKLSERLHTMRGLESVSQEERLRIAEETLRVYAPIASRLGIFSLKSELEDFCFKFLYPKEYDHLVQEIEAHGKMNEKFIEEACRVLRAFLQQEGIEAEVSGRIKHMYSIYRKLRKKNTFRLDDVHDLFAVRIVLADVHQDGREFLGGCYMTLGVLHNHWVPMPGRFKDYIAVPKLNGYRSLHTTLMGLLPAMQSQPVEVQIRTNSMHRQAEYGVASHWWYEDSRRASASLSHEEVEGVLEERRLMAKFYSFLNEHPERRSVFEALFSDSSAAGQVSVDESLRLELMEAGFSSSDVARLNKLSPSSSSASRTTFFQHQIDWLYGLEQLNDELMAEGGEDSKEVNLFEDRIFALTPQGDLKDLPVGSTPIDFAYAIHSDVGNRCYQVKVNGKIAGLDVELKNGDIVEVLTRKEPQPNRYWLSFVKTTQAKAKIKSWFRSLDREKNIKAGRLLLNKVLKSVGKPSLGPNYSLLKNYGGHELDLSHREHIVEQVGDGTITPNHVLRTLFSEEELLGERISKSPIHKPAVVAPVVAVDAGESRDVLITGQRDMPFTLSACCKPRYPQVIVGYVTRGNSIRIHQLACRELSDIDTDRVLEASWFEAAQPVHYQVGLRVESTDRVGLLKDMVNAVADLNISLVDFPLVEKKGEAVIRDLVVEIPDYDLLEKLIYRLESIENVVKVQKV